MHSILIHDCSAGLCGPPLGPTVPPDRIWEPYLVQIGETIPFPGLCDYKERLTKLSCAVGGSS